MNNTMFFSSKARLAEGITAEILYGMVTVGIEIDMNAQVIMDADCTLSTEISRKFFKNVLVGYDLSKGLDPLLERLKARYRGDVVKALVAALKSIYREFVVTQRLIKQ